MAQHFSTYSDFLESPDFIQWRLTGASELDSYWHTFAQEHPELKDEFEKAIDVFSHVHINKADYGDTDVLYQQIMTSFAMRKKRSKRLSYYISSAAAIALLVFITTMYLTNSSLFRSSSKDIIIGKTLPGKDIQLITGNNAIVLGQNSKVTLADGQMSFTDSANTEQTISIDDVQVNKLIVPYGKRSSLVLADGSEIWVNSGSELVFPSHFDKDKREIHVVGEIYIEVTKSARQSFIVHTPRMSVKVYGTKFNVSAYENLSPSVVLVEGKVALQTSNSDSEFFLSPNDLAVLSESGSFQKQKVDVNKYISWKNGYLVFEDTPMSDVLKQIEKYYNLSFNFSKDVSIQKRACTGKIYLSEDIDNVLMTLTLLTSTKHTKLNNQSYIISTN